MGRGAGIPPAEGSGPGSWPRRGIRSRQESFDGTLDLPEAFQKVLLCLPVRIGDVVSQGVILRPGRIRVKERKQENLRNMIRKGLSQEDCLAMLHREDHIAALDHPGCNRFRPVMHQIDGKGFRDPNGKIRRRDGYPYVYTRREGTDPRQIPLTRDLPEISLGERTSTNISLAYEENGPG